MLNLVTAAAVVVVIIVVLIILLPTTQFAYWKGLGTGDVLLCMSNILQSALESRQEARIVWIDFSAAFDRVNYIGILYKLCSVGIAGFVMIILIQFLLISQHIMVDGSWNNLVNVVSGVLQGILLLYFSCTPRSFFLFWKIS